MKATPKRERRGLPITSPATLQYLSSFVRRTSTSSSSPPESKGAQTRTREERESRRTNASLAATAPVGSLISRAATKAKLHQSAAQTHTRTKRNQVGQSRPRQKASPLPTGFRNNHVTPPAKVKSIAGSSASVQLARPTDYVMQM